MTQPTVFRELTPFSQRRAIAGFRSDCGATRPSNRKFFDLLTPSGFVMWPIQFLQRRVPARAFAPQ
jgi:hypothetical protein